MMSVLKALLPLRHSLCVAAVCQTACSICDVESAGIKLPGQVTPLLNVKFHHTK